MISYTVTDWDITKDSSRNYEWTDCLFFPRKEWKQREMIFFGRKCNSFIFEEEKYVSFIFILSLINEINNQIMK